MKKNEDYKNRTISVIVPVFNGEKTINRCIDGLLKQTFKPTEIIVVDDGSTDRTGTILDQYSLDNENIVVFHQENSGVSSARNRGLSEATSDFIVFIDSDDAVGEDYVDTLMRHSDYDFVTCGFHIQNKKMEWNDFVFVDEGQKADEIRQHPSVYLGKYYFGSPWAKLYKREIIDACGLRFSTDVHLGEDIVFNFKYLLETKDIKIIPICEYYYYYHESSLSHSSYAEIGKWTLDQERLINSFFNCSSEDEEAFIQNRDFEILQRLLKDHWKEWTNQQINDLYYDSLFQKSIQYKKTEGRFSEKLMLFSLDHNIYFIYETFLQIRNLFKNM